MWRSASVAAFASCPGFSRPRMSSHQVERPSSQLRSFACTRSTRAMGAATSKERPTVGPKKEGGVTPTIVKGTPFRSSVRPTASAAPPKRRCQNA